MRLYAGYKVPDILTMPAKSFLALLNAGGKLEVYELKKSISVVSYPYMEQDSQEEYMQSLMLPEDILNDIVIAETSETEKQKFKEALEE